MNYQINSLATVYECLKAFFDTQAFLERTDTLSTNAKKSLRHFFDALAFLNARLDTRVSVFKTRVFAHLRTKQLSSLRKLSLQSIALGSLGFYNELPKNFLFLGVTEVKLYYAKQIP